MAQAVPLLPTPADFHLPPVVHTASGEMRCVGKKDDCRGEFTFSWGSGAFRGITGTTPFVGGINIERKEAGRIYGYAAWPNLTYSLP